MTRYLKGSVILSRTDLPKKDKVRVSTASMSKGYRLELYERVRQNCHKVFKRFCSLF